MLDENVSPAANQPDSRAGGQPPCNPLNRLVRKGKSYSTSQWPGAFYQGKDPIDTVVPTGIPKSDHRG
eukprot:1144256-Pelagomonas_calceolata.AAC.11